MKHDCCVVHWKGYQIYKGSDIYSIALENNAENTLCFKSKNAACENKKTHEILIHMKQYIN